MGQAGADGDHRIDTVTELGFMKTPPDILPLTPAQGLEGSVRAPSTYFISLKWTEMGKSPSALPVVEKVLNYSPFSSRAR